MAEHIRDVGAEAPLNGGYTPRGTPSARPARLPRRRPSVEAGESSNCHEILARRIPRIHGPLCRQWAGTKDGLLPRRAGTEFEGGARTAGVSERGMLLIRISVPI
jgi:hypothetical protein